MRARTSPSIPVVLAALALTGCAAPPEERVSVDLPRLARALRTPPAPGPALPRPPAPLPAETRTLPALPARTLRTPKGLTPEGIRARLAAQNEGARAALAERLKEVYAAEVRRAEFARLREIEDARLAGAADVVARVRARFDAYNAERAPLAARLAFLAGYPEPGPVLSPAVFPDSKEAERRTAEARALRDRIAALDAAFDAAVKSERDAADAALAARLAALTEDLRRLRTDLEGRAEREARAGIRRLNRSLALRLAGDRPIVLPAVPARTLDLPATSPLPEVPSVPATPPADPTPRLRAELRIWSGLRRVRVVPAGPGVRDATPEFERWRNPLPPRSPRERPPR